MFVCMCVCVRTYICMYVCMCMYVRMCVYVCTYVCVCMYVFVCMCLYTYVCMFVYVYMFVCMCVYTYVCMYVCVCVYVLYIHIRTYIYVCVCVCVYIYIYMSFRKSGSSIAIFTRLRAGRSGFRIPVVAGDISLLQNFHLFNRHRVLTPEMKQQNVSPTAGISGAALLLTPACLRGVDSDNFALFTFYICNTHMFLLLLWPTWPLCALLKC
jgi:nuclear pore complex protein Nup62